MNALFRGWLVLFLLARRSHRDGEYIMNALFRGWLVLFLAGLLYLATVPPSAFGGGQPPGGHVHPPGGPGGGPPPGGPDGGPPSEAQDDAKTKELMEKQQQHMKKLLAKAKTEYDVFFKEPKKVPEYWAAINFEINTGKFEIAAFFLKKMLELKPFEDADRELAIIQQVVGTGPFFHLKDVQKWSDNKFFEKETRENVKTLLKRLTKGVDLYLSAPDRISKFIINLDAPTEEERDYAFFQLSRSRERAVPYLVSTMHDQFDKPIRKRIYEAFLKFDPDFLPPLLEILKSADAADAKDRDLRPVILDIFRKRGDTRCIPYLWHLSFAAQYPPEVRDLARDNLAYLLQINKVSIFDAKSSLKLMAEKCYQHKLKVAPGGNAIWKWDGHSIPLKPDYMMRREAEEFFGLRYAREALDLDPAYQPAQEVLLNLVLERTFDRHVDRFFLPETAPEKFILANDVTVEVKGEKAKPDKLKPGMNLFLTFGDRGDDRELIGKVIKIRGGLEQRKDNKEIAAVLKRFDDATITVGSEQYKLTDEVIVELHGEKAGLGNLKPGMELFLTLGEKGDDPELVGKVKKIRGDLEEKKDDKEIAGVFRKFDDAAITVSRKPIPDEFRQLLSSIDSDILITVLERALDEHNIPVVLPVMDILGQRGELRAALPSEARPSRGITRALFYPDRRVQFAALTAMMRLPYRPVPVGSQRIVELLRRFLAAEPISRAMVAMCPLDDRTRIRNIFKKAGFDDLELRTQTLDETFERLSKANDYDIIFVHPAVPVRIMPYILTQLRRDQDLGRLPLIVFSKLENREKLNKLCERYPNTYVELETFLELPETASETFKLADDVKVEIHGEPAEFFNLKPGMDLLITLGETGDRPEQVGKVVKIREGLDLKKDDNKEIAVVLKKLAGRTITVSKMQKLRGLAEERMWQANSSFKITMEERKKFRDDALTYLWKMGRGEIPGYDIRPAEDTLRDAIRFDDLAPKALETAGRLPGRDAQGWLAGVIMDSDHQNLRLQAVILLKEHIQKNGLLLSDPQITGLKDTYRDAAGTELKAQLALVLSSLRISPASTGHRLNEFKPEPQPPGPPSPGPQPPGPQPPGPQPPGPPPPGPPP